MDLTFYESVKILFWNNGRLPETWSLEQLLSKHSSQPFNPDIANAFFRSGMIEAWGARYRANFGRMPNGRVLLNRSFATRQSAYGWSLRIAKLKKLRGGKLV
jgi:hypothetical protein